MVGAKQFAIMRKIIEEKEENPIIKRITLPIPESISGDNNFSTVAGSFLDRINAAPKKKSKKPNMINNFSNVERNELPEEISDDLLNMLTYKVFQNIQSYFNHRHDDYLPDNRQQIKINISL